MISKNNAPNAAQKRWLEWVGSQVCINCGAPANVHHCAGRSASHNKVPIGHWWILPLCRECHQGDHGIHGDLLEFRCLGDILSESRWHGGKPRKQIEKELFDELLELAAYKEIESPSSEIVDAIRSYHR